MKNGYVFVIEPDGDGFMGHFPDVPEAVTGGDTQDEILEMGADALMTAIAGYMSAKKPVPMPAALSGKDAALVYLDEVVQAKVLLWNAMLAEGVTKVELAKRMGVSEGQVRKILDPHQNVTVSTLVSAARALKKRIVMDLVAA